MEGQEPGKTARVEPDLPRAEPVCPAPLLYGFIEVGCKGCIIRAQNGDDGKDADDDALRPVDKQYRCKIPVPEDRKYDGDEIGNNERDDREIMDNVPGKDSGDECRELHYGVVVRNMRKRIRIKTEVTP